MMNSTAVLQVNLQAGPMGEWPARAAVAAWIEDYNTRRRHSACQKLPLAAFEQLLAERGKEAA